MEKGVYEKLLANPDEAVEGTVKELAEKYELSIMEMTGFLDGINDSLVTPNPIEEMDEDTKVSLAFDKEKLYKNMVDAKADWLYNLPAWDEIFDAETKHALYLEQKKSGTVVVGKKIGRNDPCPCGSGKKYKKCCGKMHKVLYRLENKYIIIFERNINCSKDMYGTCLRILHTYVQQHNNNTLKSTVSILKAAEREALEDENQSPKSGESSPVDDIPNTSLEWLQ